MINWEQFEFFVTVNFINENFEKPERHGVFFISGTFSVHGLCWWIKFMQNIWWIQMYKFFLLIEFFRKLFWNVLQEDCAVNNKRHKWLLDRVNSCISKKTGKSESLRVSTEFEWFLQKICQFFTAAGTKYKKNSADIFKNNAVCV